jgi:uncharacterized membrane protein YphA (DoxX/SURF4 family)
MNSATLNNAPTTNVLPSGSRFARYGTHVARVLLGLPFLVFGLDGFLNFIPKPDPSTMPHGALAFSTALASTGYMFQLIKGTEVLVGSLLLSRRFVPLALVLLAPVMVNIVAFHAFLAPSGLPLALVFLALHLALAWTHRSSYVALLRSR